MAILRSRGQQGNVVKVANPAVDRSILAWEQRVSDAEAAALERAKEELRQEYEQRLSEAEQAVAAAERRVEEEKEAARIEGDIASVGSRVFRVFPVAPKKFPACDQKPCAPAKASACVWP